MKFKYNLLAGLVLGAMAVACDPLDDIYTELDSAEDPVTKTEEEYVLTKADYEAISKAAAKNANDDAEKRAAEDVKKQLALNDIVSADKYVPAVLNQVYYSWGKGSTVGVTYKYRLPYNKDSKLSHFRGIKSSYVNGKDYDEIWAEDGFEGAEYFAPKHPAETYLPSLLAAKFETAKKYDKVLIDYKSAESNPKVIIGEDIYAEDFSEIVTKGPIEVKDWTTLQLTGDKSWIGKNRNDNGYVEMSAYQSKGQQETVLVTPAIAITNPDAGLTFDLTYGFYKGECLTVYVSEQFDGTTFDASQWKELTQSFKFPAGNPGGYIDATNVGTASLAAYNGKTVYFAFLYKGNGNSVTTTVQIDNVKVTSTKISHPSAQKQSALYQFDGENWEVVNDPDVVLVTPADYDAMGKPGKHDNFSDSDKAQNYLPQFLAAKFPYAQNRESKIVIYKFYKSGDTKIYADEYKYEGTWNYVPGTQFEMHEKESFLHNGEKWLYDPCVKLELVKDDYVFLVEWAKSNKPAYVDTQYGNSEYWFGASYYKNNFDFRMSKRSSNDPDNVVPKDEAEARKYFEKMAGEGILLILADKFPDSPAQSNGVDLYYKVTCAVYDAANWKYVYTVRSLGGGKFQVEGEPVSTQL